MLKIAMKSFLFFFAVVGYVSSAFVIILMTPDRQKRRARLGRNISFFCRYFGLPIFGIKIAKESLERVDLTKNYLIVCNHLSYTDIVALAACFPSVFVTSVEVRESFFVGFMTALGGSLFVNRLNRNFIKTEVNEMTKCLASGLNVVVFPEATSSNGDSVLPFKKSLLKSALDANVDVLPTCISYTQVNGEAITYEQREKLCYYGDKTFFNHLVTIMGFKSFTAKIRFLDQIQVSEMPDRKVLAEKAYAVIVEAYSVLSQLSGQALVRQE